MYTPLLNSTNPHFSPTSGLEGDRSDVERRQDAGEMEKKRRRDGGGRSIRGILRPVLNRSSLN